MTDPWAETREYVNAFNEKATLPIFQQDLKDLLTDADALLAVARAAYTLGGYLSAGGEFIIKADDLGRLTEALDALPEHLR